MAVAKILAGVDTAGERKKRGSCLFIHVGFQAQESLDTLKGIPMGGRSGPNIGCAGFPAALDVPLIGRWLDQDNLGQFVNGVGLELATKRETGDAGQGVVEENQFGLDLPAISESRFDIGGGDNIEIVILEESF